MEQPDIRQLQVFDQIYKLRSVSDAALALGLGQPAVSVALAKMRQHYGDALFVRTSRGMQPTPFGEGLVRPVRAALEALEVVLGHHDVFDPATSKRSFRICMTDISQLVLLPLLWRKLHVEAPGVEIDILPLSADLAQMLESGAADLALGFIPQLDAGFYQTVLFRQRLVCMVSAHHPRIRERLTLEDFQNEEHAVISSSGAAPLLLDQVIERLGLHRRVALKIPNFIGAALVVEHTDFIITIPDRLGQALQGRGAMKTFPVPFALPDYEVKQHWHERFHNDPGARWLRRAIAELLNPSTPG